MLDVSRVHLCGSSLVSTILLCSALCHSRTKHNVASALIFVFLCLRPQWGLEHPVRPSGKKSIPTSTLSLSSMTTLRSLVLINSFCPGCPSGPSYLRMCPFLVTGSRFALPDGGIFLLVIVSNLPPFARSKRYEWISVPEVAFGVCSRR